MAESEKNEKKEEKHEKHEHNKKDVHKEKKEEHHKKKHKAHVKHAEKKHDEKKDKKVNTEKEMPKTGMILGVVLILAVIAVVAIALSMPAPTVVPDDNVSGDNQENADSIGQGDVVQVKYKGTFTDGEVFDEGDLSFMVGAGQVIEGFEEAVTGLSEGSKKTVTIPPEKAYGEKDPEKVISIPLTQEFDKIVNISSAEFEMTFEAGPEIGREYKIPDMKWSVKVTDIQGNDTVFIEQLVANGEELEYPYGTGIATVNEDTISVTLQPTIGASVQTMFGNALITEDNGTHMWLDFNSEMAGKTLVFEIEVLNVTKFEAAEEDPDSDNAESEDICATSGLAKSSKPKMEVFVMSLCPFGLQMEKGVIPVAELFGDKADIEIKFVNYIMHGKDEIDYNTYHYCIQKEQPEKFWEYLRCFVGNGNHESCVSETGVDSEMLNTCFENADSEFEITKYYEDKASWASGRFPLYKVHDEDNIKYGVRGSPTIVINGKEASVYPRDPETVKQYLCCAFENPPEECSQTLSTENPSSGLGWGTTDTGTAASCG